MFRLIESCALAALCLAAPSQGHAAFCVAVNGGFGGGGTSYVAPGFKLPTANHCAPWAGYTKPATTGVAFASGTGCLAAGGKVLTLSIFDTDPSFFGTGASASDQVQLCPTGVSGCPISGQDSGTFSGTAAEQACTTSLLTLPQTHD